MVSLRFINKIWTMPPVTPRDQERMEYARTHADKSVRKRLWLPILLGVLIGCLIGVALAHLLLGIVSGLAIFGASLWLLYTWALKRHSRNWAWWQPVHTNAQGTNRTGMSR